MQDRRIGERRSGARRDAAGLRRIVEKLADGVVIVGPDGRIRFANPSAEELFTRPSSALVGTDFGVPIGNEAPAEIDVLRASGETVTAELRVVPIDWEGETDALLVSLRDITDRRRADERAWQLERERAARAEAEAASQAKSDFLATMSHELRTPLNAVIGYSELLDLGIAGPLTAEQRQQISRIRASGEHLLGLVNEVLDLARMEAGRLAVHIAPARAMTAADAALTLTHPFADARGVSLAATCTGPATAVYEADEDRVRQVLVNLLTNAVKFSEPGTRVLLECGVSEHAETPARVHGPGPWVFLRVRDAGIGIPADRLRSIFEPFVQVQAGHTRAQDGSGLGLTISRRLARLMKGDLTVQSVVGDGSIFTLWLPAARPDAVPGVHQPEAETLARAAGLADIGELMLRELEPTLECFVARLRNDEIGPGVRGLKFSQLADHVGSFIADVASMLIAIDEAEGQPSSLLVDSAEIHRMVATRHGAQRARLGWNGDMIRKEHAVLRDELERVVRRAPRTIPTATVDEAIAIIDRLMEQALQSSLWAARRTHESVRDSTTSLPLGA